MEGPCEYLVRSLPNRWATHAALWLARRALIQSGSKWRLRVRYRGPKVRGCRGHAASLKREHARRLSVYLYAPSDQARENRYARERWAEEAKLRERLKTAEARAEMLAAELDRIDRMRPPVMAPRNGSLPRYEPN